jgi:hypothetical protein
MCGTRASVPRLREAILHSDEAETLLVLLVLLEEEAEDDDDDDVEAEVSNEDTAEERRCE